MWQKSWNGGFATETRKDERSFGKACRRTLPGQEGQPFWRPGGAVAGTRETCPSHGREFPENSQLNLRGTRHLDLARHIHGRWRGSGKWCLWGRAGGRAVAGGRKPRAPATAVQSQRVLPLSLVWLAGLWRQKSGWRRNVIRTERASGLLLASETSCKRRTESFLGNGGVKENPW